MSRPTWARKPLLRTITVAAQGTATGIHGIHGISFIARTPGVPIGPAGGWLEIASLAAARHSGSGMRALGKCWYTTHVAGPFLRSSTTVSACSGGQKDDHCGMTTPS